MQVDIISSLYSTPLDSNRKPKLVGIQEHGPTLALALCVAAAASEHVLSARAPPPSYVVGPAYAWVHLGGIGKVEDEREQC